MIQRLVAVALRMPSIVVMIVAGVIAFGVLAYRELDIEAYPNPVPPLVEIIAQPDGMSAEDVERYVTVPLEIGLAGMPGLEHTRSQSLFGLARREVLLPLGHDVRGRAPGGAQPPATSIQLSRGRAGADQPVERDRRGLPLRAARARATASRELKTAQDWILERQFKQVPGVIDVVSFGGETKQYQVNVDPFRLARATA